MAEQVERMERGRTRQSLRRHRLEDVTLANMLLQPRHMAFVPFTANIRGIFLIRNNRALWRQRIPRLKQGVNGALKHFLAFVVFGFQLGIGAPDGDKSDDLNDPEEVIKGDNRIENHEKRLRNAQHILERPGRLGLKVLDTIVSYVTDGSAGEWWKYQSRNRRNAELGELILEGGKRVAFRAMAGASLEDFMRVYRVKISS